MIVYLEQLLGAMRPAFTRRATFLWFVIVFVGFLLRIDTFGVSSVVRALYLAPYCYPSLIHFFHSSAFSLDTLIQRWQKWLIKEKFVYRVGNRIVMLGDHTKKPKDGRRMPEVTTLHQDSETSSKPSFFRGHHWGCISMLLRAKNKFFAAPLWAEIHRDYLSDSRATRIVKVAGRLALSMEESAYLVLDAFFAVGSVFLAAAQYGDSLHILTRAKKNVVAYQPPPKCKILRRGRPRIYGKKVKLFTLFERRAHKFETAETMLYQKKQTVRYLSVDLVWRPIRKKLRFFLIESSRGRIILMSSDLTMEPLVALNLFCRRVSIETLFNNLKNLLGGLHYRFWSKYLKPVSRRPLKKKTQNPISTCPKKTQNTLAAIEKFVFVQMLVLGSLQLIACRFESEIGGKSRCWLRTPCGEIPSEFVTKMAVSNIIRSNLFGFAKDWITQLILPKQNVVDIPVENTRYSKKVA